MKKFIIILFILFSFLCIQSQSIIKSYIVDASATVNSTTPSIEVKWNASMGANTCQIRRKLKEAAVWESMITLDPKASSYIDNNVQVGKTYEYHITRNLPYISNNAVQYISVGVDLPVIDYRGKVILLVESSISDPLKEEINRLMADMNLDGWQVIRHDVPKTETAVNVKKIIKADYVNDPNNIKTVFLLGHVPVALSGFISPDGHAVQPWVADGYYGDMDGIWTDDKINNTSGTDPATHNVPGDGKFDQSIFPSPIELQVGRVDLYDLPKFTSYDKNMNEVELLRRYLNKDHAYRTGEFRTLQKGLIDDQFYITYGENMSTGSWGSSITFFGLKNISDSYQNNHIFVPNRNTHYVFAHAGGPGSNTSSGSIVNTDNFASSQMTFNYVFTNIFGSFLGNWYKQDNIMRAALASKGSILTCAWSGRPYWWYQHMANGENIGYSAKVNMNNNNKLYYANDNYHTHITLLGDPTLRLHTIIPPSNLKCSIISNHANLHWSPSPDSIQGYHVYKADSLNMKYVRLTSSIIADTTFVDNSTVSANYVYVVKAVRKEINRSGTYFNTSRGIMISNIPGVKDIPIIIAPLKQVKPIPDTAITEYAAFNYDLSKYFYDPAPGEALTYSLYKADGKEMPTGWTFNPATQILSVSKPSPAYHSFILKVNDMQLFEKSDTFTVRVGNPPAPPIVAVNFSEKTDINVYPNPFAEEIHFEGSIGQGKIALSIFNQSGSVVFVQNYRSSDGNIQETLNLDKLPAGVYFYVITTGTDIYQGKIIKL